VHVVALTPAVSLGQANSGQLDLAVGQVGRLDDPGSVSVPNGVNPDIILGWTCNSFATCGAAAAGPSVAVQAFGVTVQPGSMSISAPSSAPPVVTPGQIGPTATYGVANERAYVNLGLADLDADSETLGAPVTYLTVGEVRPMLILRSPPVQFDVFDDGSDGLISYADTDDVNQCFALNQNCGFGTTYDTVSTIASSVSGSLSNSWGISGAVTTNAWFGDQEKDPTTDEVKCDDPVCVGLSVKLAVEYEAQQEDAAKAGRTFTYSSKEEVGPRRRQSLRPRPDHRDDRVAGLPGRVRLRQWSGAGAIRPGRQPGRDALPVGQRDRPGAVGELVAVDGAGHRAVLSAHSNGGPCRLASREQGLPGGPEHLARAHAGLARLRVPAVRLHGSRW
jgi:hypothetical protein